MLTTVTQLKARNALRNDVDLEALVWAIDCLNIGYLFLRSIHAADRRWDDAGRALITYYSTILPPMFCQ